MMAQRIGPIHFDVRYEAAVWKGPMRASNLLKPPLLVVGVDDGLQRMTIEEFSTKLERGLEIVDFNGIIHNRESPELLGSGFTDFRTTKVHIPTFHRSPHLLFMARGSNAPFPWNVETP